MFCDARNLSSSLLTIIWPIILWEDDDIDILPICYSDNVN